MTYTFENILAWQKAHLFYISDTDFSDLHDALEDASKMLYLYCNGIINNNGVKD